ncbi:hypothetical protein SETIT_1G062800v2 [Setaria italica]|uniref:Uncharacterized protein n=1 Tax=Setaria italica TaxID=4555 RepID=A0A368PHE7_SETIT|nr:hypothetical protein SETIT_1G062800v2 [Setaria italica]
MGRHCRRRPDVRRRALALAPPVLSLFDTCLAGWVPGAGAALPEWLPAASRSRTDIAGRVACHGWLSPTPGGGALSVAPHLIHPTILADDATDPAVQRTVYDVTVIFRATARLGPTRLQYFVVPAAAAAPNSGGADRELDAVDLFLILPGSFFGRLRRRNGRRRLRPQGTPPR